MKGKGLLYAAAVLEILYLLVVSGILLMQGQAELYELEILKVVIGFVFVMACSIVLGKKLPEEEALTERAVTVVMAVVMILSPVFSWLLRVGMSALYARTQGAEVLAAYSMMQTYLSMAGAFQNAALILILMHAAATWGAKRQE